MRSATLSGRTNQSRRLELHQHRAVYKTAASLFGHVGKQEREDATWEFLKFMVSPEMQAFWNAKTGYFPVTVAAAQTATFKENIAKYPQFQVAIDQLHSSAPQYSGALLSVFSEARQIVQNYIARLANKEVDAQGALNGMAKDINKSIETYNLVNY